MKNLKICMFALGLITTLFFGASDCTERNLRGGNSTSLSSVNFESDSQANNSTNLELQKLHDAIKKLDKNVAQLRKLCAWTFGACIAIFICVELTSCRVMNLSSKIAPSNA